MSCRFAAMVLTWATMPSAMAFILSDSRTLRNSDSRHGDRSIFWYCVSVQAIVRSYDPNGNSSWRRFNCSYLSLAKIQGLMSTSPDANRPRSSSPFRLVGQTARMVATFSLDWPNCSQPGPLSRTYPTPGMYRRFAPMNLGVLASRLGWTPSAAVGHHTNGTR